MQKLVEGVGRFESEIFPAQREHYARLASGQNPVALFIACSDSRVSPGTLTQTLPGELFVVRNAGNLVPPHGAARGGVGASIEYAVSVLKVRHVIVCGHSDCGVLKATLKPETVQDLPNVRDWLEMTESTRRMLRDNCPDLSGQELLDRAVEHNVMMQIQHLQTHPSVASALMGGRVELHAWTYRIESGRVLAFCSERRAFVPLVELWAETAGGASQVGRSGVFKRP
ncbi:MAG: carbonic anhydrase [Candidatus Eremiobacterota bacterium]